MGKAILDALRALVQEDNLQWLCIWFLMFNMGRVTVKIKKLEDKK